ncbi:MAG: hypothetical protein GY722_04325, partial [bacterium]|nr:hypothetical protein [bacterium]
MSDRRHDRQPIEVSAKVATEAGMPEDLNASLLGPYEVPDPARRRRAGLVYLVAAIVTAGGIGLGLPSGMWVIVVLLGLIAAYHRVAGSHL